MQHCFASPTSQSVACASRSRLRPVVSLSNAPPSGAQRSGRCRRKQVSEQALMHRCTGFHHFLAGYRTRTSRFRESTTCTATAGHQYKTTVHFRASEDRASVRQSCKRAALPFALEQSFLFPALQPRPARPNHSLKRSANGRPPGPGRWYSVHSHPFGPGVLPSSSA